jgi:hypothetical protein
MVNISTALVVEPLIIYHYHNNLTIVQYVMLDLILAQHTPQMGQCTSLAVPIHRTQYKCQSALGDKVRCDKEA